MKHLILALAAALCCAPALAQTSTTAPKAQAKPANAAAKKAKAAKEAPEPEVALSPADDAQRQAAELAHVGDYACEFNQTVKVSRNAKDAAYLDVGFAGKAYTMKPVLSSTGAVRLEDVRGRMLVVQIATKSMMMDTHAGRRVVDDCVHEKQAEFRKTMASAPAQDGIGIEAKK